jgi:hypothetical protein
MVAGIQPVPRDRNSTGIVGAAAVEAPLTASSISIRASPMSRNRRAKSCRKQRSSSSRTLPGVSMGRPLSFGSSRRTAASMSAELSPVKSRRPASIS